MSLGSSSLAQSTISDTAQVRYHEGNKVPPTMLPGRVTPALLLQWEEHATAYFDKAKTPDAEKVSSVLTCWRDSEIDNFIKMNKTRFRAPEFTFLMFMTEIRKRFLDSLWQNNIMRNVVNAKMESTESFSKFANRVIAGNNLLEGTGIRLDAAALRKTLTGNMSEFLASKLDRLRTTERERLAAIEGFEEWMAEIVAFDREATSDLKRIAEMLREDVSYKRQRLDDSVPQNPPPIPFQPSQIPNTSAPPNVYCGTGPNAIHPPPPPNNSRYPQSTSGRKRCPPLTQTEIALLNKHKGCRKCRRFYVSHRGNECPNDFPDGATYVPLSEDVAYDAMRKCAIASTYSGPPPETSPSTHNAVMPPLSQLPSSSSFSSAYNGYFAPPAIPYSTPAPSVTDHTSAQLEDLPTGSSDNSPPVNAPVGAILPSSSYNFVLSGDSDTSGYSDDVSPISCPHLIWRAQIWNDVDVQIPFDCLLDDGAHLVLIRPETVTDLGLPIRRLHEPVSVTLALNGNPDSLSVFHDYVSLSLSSLNNAWSSKPVRALIAPGLCSSILLGLPFLVHNKIVIDHDSRTAIVKGCGFDLLNENSSCRVAPPVSKNLSPKQKRLLILKLKKDVLSELKLKISQRALPFHSNTLFENAQPFNPIAAITSRIESLASQKTLIKLEDDIKHEYRDVFRPIPHISELPTTETARIHLKNAYQTIAKRQYDVPRQFRDSFAVLIQQRLDSGFIRPSSSAFASPSFIIPKADKSALPRWVCDYRQLNENTILDNFSLPRVDDILADCAKGKIWATIDMTDSFFQTRMHPDDIHKTAVTTPFGNYEWCVMPMGFRNSPAIQQRRVTNALRQYIGKICHVYLDDIIVWSDSLDEHIKNVRTIMDALRKAKLYVNPKKTHLFCYEIKFLGHIISQKGIEADGSKVDKILDWPVPKNANDVRAFLGLVRYLNAFLPRLATQSHILSRLTTKECDKNFPEWTQVFQDAFDKIKGIVVSRECLTVIDHKKLDINKIFLTADASDRATGAVLSFGPTWETARPVAFDSKSLKDAELNYPTHEKELLAILRGIRKWKVDLLGSPFFVYTDHKTLLNFHTQKDLSRRQARWMEELSIYDCKFVYVKGSDNSVADALSRYPQTLVSSCSDAESSASHPYHTSSSSHFNILLHPSPSSSPLATIAALVDANVQKRVHSAASIDDKFLNDILNGYTSDPWCQKLLSASKGMPELSIKDGLWFLGNRLIVPGGCGAREHIFKLTHDTLGHFGFFKSYENIRHSYFWPGMRKDLEEGYIPSCAECLRNKSSTSKPSGPLHPLPIPDERCESVSMDFIGPLPPDNGFDYILTITDRLNSDVRIIPTKSTLTAEELAITFFDSWYCENGLPLNIISDRDKLFISKFWRHLMLLTGVKHKYSSSYHPQSNGASERTNKTVNQCIRFHVERNQTGWAKALPLIRFHIMNTINKSTGFSPFQLRFGRAPRVLPPLLPPPPSTSSDYVTARAIIEEVSANVAAARDNLMLAKISQAYHSNASRGNTVLYKVGDKVMLSTLNRRKEYKSQDQMRVAKFMPRYDGPYLVVDTHEAASTVTLDIPNAPNIFPTFHTSHIKPFKQNDDSKWPSRTLEKPGPVGGEDSEEFLVDKIIDHKKIGKSNTKYLVRWVGYGPEDDQWISGRDLEDNEALDKYLENS